MQIPSMLTKVAGEQLLAADWNDDVRDAINFLLNPPACKAQTSTSLSRGSAVGFSNDLGLGTELWDNDGIHVAGSAEFIVVTQGRYIVAAQAEIEANSTGTRGLRVLLNGVTEVMRIRNRASENGVWSESGSAEVDLEVGDILTMSIMQNSGVSLNVSADKTEMSIRWSGLGD